MSDPSAKFAGRLGKFCREDPEDPQLRAEFAAIQKWWMGHFAAQKCINQPENWQFF
jgi:hypothetical protein